MGDARSVTCPPPPLLTLPSSSLPSSFQGPIAVKAAVLTIVERMAASGTSHLYTGPINSPAGWAYAALTVAALDLLHDTWFYWTHRALHTRLLYKPIHAMHHRSVAPTAFTGYSLHVVEAAIVFANEILVCFLFPIHAGLHRAYHLWTTVIHNGGHAGYEIAPFIPSIQQLAWRLAGRAGHPAALSTVSHHDLHHRYPTRHFALYFTHWDAALGTEHPGYRGGLASGLDPAVVAAAARVKGGGKGGPAGSPEAAAEDSIPAWRGEAAAQVAAAAGVASPRGRGGGAGLARRAGGGLAA